MNTAKLSGGEVLIASHTAALKQPLISVSPRLGFLIFFLLLVTHLLLFSSLSGNVHKLVMPRNFKNKKDIFYGTASY